MNGRQIQNLRRKRDLLLQRLLSGQVNANQFHHENWQEVVINDVELSGFTRRTLSFIARP
jgi:hypothetical protein